MGVVLSQRRRAFTFIEILAVMAMLALVVGIAVSAFRAGSIRIKRAAQNLSQDIQASYFQSIQRGEVLKLQFTTEPPGYVITSFQLPAPPPPKDETDAYREWEEENEARLKKLEEFSAEERRNLTQLDRGDFVVEEQREFPDPIEVIQVRNAAQGLDTQTWSLIFYPTGDMDSALIILDDGDGRSYSLITNPVTGNVDVFSRALTEEEWKKNQVEE